MLLSKLTRQGDFKRWQSWRERHVDMLDITGKCWTQCRVGHFDLIVADAEGEVGEASLESIYEFSNGIVIPVLIEYIQNAMLRQAEEEEEKTFQLIDDYGTELIAAN